MEDEQKSNYLIWHFSEYRNKPSMADDAEIWAKESTVRLTTELMNIFADDFIIDELKRRYWYKRKEERLEILRFMLEYNEETREWGYRKLQQHWYAECTEIICELWESHKEKTCAWLVVEHAPLEYVKKHLFELQVYEYGCVCLRLGNDPDFQIDKKRLLPCEYMYIATKLKLEVSEEECELCLYLTIADSLKNAKLKNYTCAVFDFESLSDESRNKITMVTDYLFKTAKRRYLLQDYRKFSQRLHDETAHRLHTQRPFQYVSPSEIARYFIEVAYELFPEKYLWMLQDNECHSIEECPF